MLKIGQNWGKIANYPPQCSTKICTPVEKDYSNQKYSNLKFKSKIVADIQINNRNYSRNMIQYYTMHLCCKTKTHSPYLLKLLQINNVQWYSRIITIYGFATCDLVLINALAFIWNAFAYANAAVIV